MGTKTLLIYNYFDTGYYCLDECLHVCYHWFLCVCVWCPWYVWLFSQSLSLYLCICFCESACVPAFAFVCACTYWQGFKETFSLHLSLICPAEYRELFTLQNQGSLGGFAALKVSLGSGHTCVQKKKYWFTRWNWISTSFQSVQHFLCFIWLHILMSVGLMPFDEVFSCHFTFSLRLWLSVAILWF